MIILNAYGQQIGPTNATVFQFSQFLGTIAKDPSLTPLNYLQWPSLPTHNDIWEYVLEKYIVPEEGKKWVLETINESWCVYKSRLKKKHFYDYNTNRERWNNRPKRLPENQFRDLLDHWNNISVEEESRMNRSNRQHLYDMDTMGPKSLAVLRQELQQPDPNKEEPSQHMIYKASRSRNLNKTYKTDDLTSKNNIERMDTLKSQQHEKNKSDPYYEVVSKPEHHGRVRLLGKGVTKSSLK